MVVGNKEYSFFTDRSIWSLLIANIFTLILAITQGWNLLVLMWIYWGQSVIIGIFNFVKILNLKDYSTANFKINDKNVKPSEGTKIFVAVFFLFHYGFFHFGYMIFLVIAPLFSMFANFSPAFGGAGMNSVADSATLGLVQAGDVIFIFLSILLFLGHHWYSYYQNKKRDESKVKNNNIGKMMFFPYARIIPMHLTIIIGFVIDAVWGLILFLFLKIIADIIMHYIEHK